MRLSLAGIVTTFHIETVYEKRQDLAQQAGCSEPRDDVSVSCRASERGQTVDWSRQIRLSEAVWGYL
jgi:hypothetical protein